MHVSCSGSVTPAKKFMDHTFIRVLIMQAPVKAPRMWTETASLDLLIPGMRWGPIRLHQYDVRDKGLDVRKINLRMELLCRQTTNHQYEPAYCGKGIIRIAGNI